MNTVILDGIWEMKQENEVPVYQSQVPGSVISCLLEHGVIEHPYEGCNEYGVRELMRQNFTFQRTFELAAEFLKEDTIDLVCDGIDTLADIYMNESLLTSVDNMHRLWKIPCGQLLKQHNTIRVEFKSPITYIEGYEPAPGKEITAIASGAMTGNQYLRKAHSMYGWDWGPQLPDMGIWRSIRLEAYSHIRIEQVRFNQIHHEGAVKLQTRIVFENLDMTCAKDIVRIKVHDPEGTCLADISEAITGCHQDYAIQMKQPKLWWPNGFGEQPLYQMTVEISDSEGKSLEEQSWRIGLRTMTVSREKDQWGEEFALMVNGIKIFTKGANYIPEDAIYPNINSERLEYLIDAAVRANYNCLRIWGGGYYPADEFYDLCDEKGLIVWQDLMYACNAYDLTPEFEASIIAETRDNVRRLRHHASLGLWCGNNEIESAWHHWEAFQTQTDYVRADYIKQFEYVLPKILKEEDNQTFFWPSSPSSGGCLDNPDDENRGDKHYWDVWHGEKPFTEYQKYFFRFCSEFGFQSFPCQKTIDAFAKPEEQNIFSEVMESHQKNGTANGKILYYISENFLYPKDFGALLYISQILQGMAIKYGVEHWRRNRGRCMGAIYWQMNDNWPVASWSSVDYYGRFKALHYMAANFYAQVTGSMKREAEVVGVYVSNEGLSEETVQVSVRLKDMNLQVLDACEFVKTIGAQSVELIGERDYAELVKCQKNQVFLEAVFTYPDGKKQVEAEPFVPYKHLQLQKPEYQISVTEKEDAYQIKVAAEVFAPFAELRFAKMDGILSDNFLMLTEKEGQVVSLQKCDIRNDEEKINAEELLEQLQVYSIYDSYH